MGLIIKKLPVSAGLLDEEGNLVEKEVEVLFRTGVINSLIKREVAEELCNIIPSKSKDLWFFTKNIRVSDKCSFETIVDKKAVEDTALILDDVIWDNFNWDYDMVLGTDTMQRYDMVLNPFKETVQVKRYSGDL